MSRNSKSKCYYRDRDGKGTPPRGEEFDRFRSIRFGFGQSFILGWMCFEFWFALFCSFYEVIEVTVLICCTTNYYEWINWNFGILISSSACFLPFEEISSSARVLRPRPLSICPSELAISVHSVITIYFVLNFWYLIILARSNPLAALKLLIPDCSICLVWRVSIPWMLKKLDTFPP